MLCNTHLHHMAAVFKVQLLFYECSLSFFPPHVHFIHKCKLYFDIVTSQLRDQLLLLHVREAWARQDDTNVFVKQNAACLPESCERCAK